MKHGSDVPSGQGHEPVDAESSRDGRRTLVVNLVIIDVEADNRLVDCESASEDDSV
jgi:hypothetical protein